MEWNGNGYLSSARAQSQPEAHNSKTVGPSTEKVQNKEIKDTILFQEDNGHDHDDGERNRTDITLL